MSSDRNSVLGLDDTALLAECRVESFRGSGRGGQKRNVTDSAVRVTHRATGISAASDETRSQINNRKLALELLRREIALQCREPAAAGLDLAHVPGRRSPDYARWMAGFLDVMEEAGYAVGGGAQAIGLSTGKLVKLLAADPALWKTVNRKREERGLKRLRIP